MPIFPEKYILQLGPSAHICALVESGPPQSGPVGMGIAAGGGRVSSVGHWPAGPAPWTNSQLKRHFGYYSFII